MRYPVLVSASILVAGALVGVPTLGNAQSTSDKIEDKADKAVDKARSATESTKAAISDSWLTSKTKIALVADKRVKGRQVSVETVRGTVTLRGKVDSEEAKAAAESIAKGIEGVQSVNNELQVVPLAERKAVGAMDTDIKMAQQALKDNGYNPGPIDGVQGPQTMAALKAYQKAEGLQVTGRADTETLGKLGVSAGGASSTPTDSQAAPGPQKKRQSP